MRLPISSGARSSEATCSSTYSKIGERIEDNILDWEKAHTYYRKQGRQPGPVDPASWRPDQDSLGLCIRKVRMVPGVADWICWQVGLDWAPPQTRPSTYQKFDYAWGMSLQYQRYDR